MKTNIKEKNKMKKNENCKWAGPLRCQGARHDATGGKQDLAIAAQPRHVSCWSREVTPLGDRPVWDNMWKAPVLQKLFYNQ